MTGQEFKNIFEENFDSLRAYIYYKSADEELATDIAQECFLKLWEKKDAVALTNVNGLLYKMAHDLFINNYHRQSGVRPPPSASPVPARSALFYMR